MGTFAVERIIEKVSGAVRDLHWKALKAPSIALEGSGEDAIWVSLDWDSAAGSIETK